MSVRIMLAVNSHDFGVPTGRVNALHILDVIELEGPVPGPACLIQPSKGRVRIAGKTYPIEAYGQWVGNWCWDEITVSDDDAVDILDRLRKTSLWTIEEGEHAVFTKWKRGEKIVAEDLHDGPPDDPCPRCDHDRHEAFGCTRCHCTANSMEVQRV